MSILNKRVMPQGAVDTTMSFAQPTGSSLTWSTPSSQTAPPGTPFSVTTSAFRPGTGYYWTNTTPTITVSDPSISATHSVTATRFDVTYTGTQPAVDTNITSTISGLTWALQASNPTAGGGDLSSLTIYPGTYTANGFNMGVNGQIFAGYPAWPGGGWTLQLYTSAGFYNMNGYQSPTITGLFPNPLTNISTNTYPGNISLNLGLGATSGFTGTANYYWRTSKHGYRTKIVNFMRITFV